MARPRSEDKQAAILQAAIQAINQQGLSASTASIAHAAGIATGSLFTYFPTKDDLFAALYIQLKQATYEAIMMDFPLMAAEQVQVRHFWNAYVRWGVANPEQRRVLHLLAISEKISTQTHALASDAFAVCYEALGERLSKGGLRGAGPDFITAIMTALAETTIDFVTRHPQAAQQYYDTGFEAFWRTIG